MSSEAATFVIALGGNAISPADGVGDIPEQYRITTQSAAQLADLIAAGRHMVLTHGNGPQVGNVLRRMELAAHEVYVLPLDICVADTQGGMGYMICTCLRNELRRRGVDCPVSTIITTVEVDADDPDFANPSKPVGDHYSADRAAALRAQQGWRMIEVRGRGWRRVVPSPLPRRIIEIDLLRRLAAAGDCIVAGGGGGVPVTRDADGRYVGVEAVIDKDRTSALLASEIGAAAFVIATSVERVSLDFGKPTQRPIDRMTAAEARRWLDAGQFPPGSMGPKIEAAIDFLDRAARPDAFVLICELSKLAEALAGRSGTRIVPG